MCNWASPRGVVERRDLRKSSRHDVHVRARGFPNGSRLVGQTTTDSGKLTRWVRWRLSPAQASDRASGHARRPTGTGTSGPATPTPVTPAPPAAAPPFPQVDALRRQQQRILHRSALIDYVLAAEKRSGEALTMGDALAELLADFTDAARTIGTLLQTATPRP